MCTMTSSMTSVDQLDVWGWINNLPPTTQWNSSTISLCICSSETSRTSMNLSVTKNSRSQNPYITFSITADLNIPVSLWSSDAFYLKTKTRQSIGEEITNRLFINIVRGVLQYGPRKKSSLRFPSVHIGGELKEVFDHAFLIFTFLVCIYEAPQSLRHECLNTLRVRLTRSRQREASKHLVRVLGSNLEEQWMRSVNLAITNWITELQVSSNHSFRTPSPLFSYAFSVSGLWKVQLYCPVIAMGVEDPSTTNQDDRLLFSLKYQQLEGVIQFTYKVTFKENWIDVVVNVDNIRCDVNSLVSETLMAERGYGSEEKHFPSRIKLQLTPTLQTDVLSVSVSKSSDNPTREFGLERGVEASFDPPNSLGLTVSASETITMSMKPWKFEQSVYGDSAILNWFLHDGINGREVFSSKPSKFALLQPRAWFRDRYSSAYRPFTKRGGVIFARDEYGDNVCWKVCGDALGKTMEWEIKGHIWLTYWPNKQKTFYTETRKLEFRELLHLPLKR